MRYLLSILAVISFLGVHAQATVQVGATRTGDTTKIISNLRVDGAFKLGTLANNTDTNKVLTLINGIWMYVVKGTGGVSDTANFARMTDSTVFATISRLGLYLRIGDSTNSVSDPVYYATPSYVGDAIHDSMQTGSGSVKSFSSGDLDPLFTTTVDDATSTPAQSFTLSETGAHTYFGNNSGSTDVPNFHQIDFSELSGIPELVNSFGGQTGDITTGYGITMSGNRVDADTSKLVTPAALAIDTIPYYQVRYAPKLFILTAPPFNCRPNDTSYDCTPGLQAAIDSDVACGRCGRIMGPSGIYHLKGAVIGNHGNNVINGQIYIPNAEIGANNGTIVIEGYVPPNSNSGAFTNVIRSIEGTIFQSDIMPVADGTPRFVISSEYDSATAYGKTNFTKLELNNVIIRTNTISPTTGADTPGTMSGINAYNLERFVHNNLWVDVTSTLYNSSQPINETYGIILPHYNNADENGGGNCFVEGYRYGYQLGEHTFDPHLVLTGNDYGLITSPTTALHASTIGNLSMEENRHNIGITTAATLFVCNMDNETDTLGSSWTNYIDDINWTPAAIGTPRLNLSIGQYSSFSAGISRPLKDVTSSNISILQYILDNTTRISGCVKSKGDTSNSAPIVAVDAAVTSIGVSGEGLNAILVNSGTPSLACGINIVPTSLGSNLPRAYFKTGNSTSDGNSAILFFDQFATNSSPISSGIYTANDGNLNDANERDGAFFLDKTGKLIIASEAKNGNTSAGAFPMIFQENNTVSMIIDSTQGKGQTTFGSATAKDSAQNNFFANSGVTDVAFFGGTIKLKGAVKMPITTNGPSGSATLSSGTATVANTSVTAKSVIMIFAPNPAVNPGVYSVVITAGTGFVITSTSITDGSTVGYEIHEH